MDMEYFSKKKGDTGYQGPPLKAYLVYVKKIYQFLNSSIAVQRSHTNDQNHDLLGLWLPPGKWLTSWLLFVMFHCVLSLSHVVSFVRWGT